MEVACCYPGCTRQVRESLFDNDNPICITHKESFRESYTWILAPILRIGINDMPSELFKWVPDYLHSHIVGYYYPDVPKICSRIYLRFYDFLVIVFDIKHYYINLEILLAVRNQFYFRCRDDIKQSKLPELVYYLVLCYLRVCQDSYLSCIPKDILNIIRELVGKFIM